MLLCINALNAVEFWTSKVQQWENTVIFYDGYCYNAVSPKGTCIVNAYCQFSQQACTNFMQTYLYSLISTHFFILTTNLHWSVPNVIDVMRECGSSGEDVSVNAVIIPRNWWAIPSEGRSPEEGYCSPILRNDDRIHRYIWPRTTVFTLLASENPHF